MEGIISVLNGDREPGIYRVGNEVEADALSALCEEFELQFFYLNGEAIASKADFLTAIATAMRFPDYFGHNWDAFEECFTDLDWLPAKGFVLFYTQPEVFAQNATDDWDIVTDILQSAVEEWLETDTPMWILFQSNDSLLDGMEEV